MMRRCMMVIAILVMGLTVVSGGTRASAAPQPPSFSPVTCAAGGDTVVSWTRGHVTTLRLDWYDSSGTFVHTEVTQEHLVSPFVTQTPAGVDIGGSVEVTAYFKGSPSGAKLAPATCS